MRYAIGIDLSLTRTAVAIIEADGPRHTWSNVTKPTGDSLEDRRRRMVRIVRWVAETISINAPGPRLVAIEGPSLGQNAAGNAGKHDRSGLWWLTMCELADMGDTVVEVPPATLKLYATGKGNSGKDEVMLRSARTYADEYPAGNNDEADAFVLAALVARHAGFPVEGDGFPARNRLALDKVRWPA